MRLRVIGVGSAHGDDAVGLAVAERLAREPLAPAARVVVRQAGLDLLEELRGLDGAVIVDALRTGAPPGAVRVVAPEELALGRPGSSHALGVAHALRLAEALGWRPALRIVGVEVGCVAGPRLSPAVRAALPAACARVRAELAALAPRPAWGAAGRERSWHGPCSSAPHE